MEKIYIENNKQNNKNFLHSKSVLGTFALAIIAVIAIVIVGVNQTSYAIPEVSNKLPDTFVTAAIDLNKTVNTYEPSHPVNPYTTTEEYGSLKLFCMQPYLDFAGGITYKKGDKISDSGLLYLLAYLSSDKFDDLFNDYNDNEKLRTSIKNWTSQMSIWMYLNDSRVTPDSVIKNYAFKEGIVDKITNAKLLTVNGDDSCKYTDVYTTSFGYSVSGECVSVSTGNLTDTFYVKFVKDRVDEAVTHRGESTENVLKINKASDNFSVTSDEKYYQTSQISVTASTSGNFNGYSVELESAPEGSFIVNENGNKLNENELTNMSKDSKFYIRVPVDKVNEKNKKIEISVTGSFTTLEGNYYISQDSAKEYQTVAAVKTVTSDVQTGAEFILNYTPEVPDTGLSTAQTVYFIGLIVLLSGIGIIYANVKPSESK